MNLEQLLKDGIITEEDYIENSKYCLFLNSDDLNDILNFSKNIDQESYKRVLISIINASDIKYKYYS